MPTMIYYVWGGIFEDTSFRVLTEGTEESYGPFHTEAEADRVWRDKASRNIDIAQHRLYVLSLPQPE